MALRWFLSPPTSSLLFLISFCGIPIIYFHPSSRKTGWGRAHYWKTCACHNTSGQGGSDSSACQGALWGRKEDRSPHFYQRSPGGLGCAPQWNPIFYSQDSNLVEVLLFSQHVGLYVHAFLAHTELKHVITPTQPYWFMTDYKKKGGANRNTYYWDPSGRGCERDRAGVCARGDGSTDNTSRGSACRRSSTNAANSPSMCAPSRLDVRQQK